METTTVKPAALSNCLRQLNRPVLLLALFQFVLHIWVNAHDHFFRDEFYYMAAGKHLGLGYVDFPPFVALAAAFSRALLGSSLVAIRLLPALVGALLVWLAAQLAAELGGDRTAQTLAALAVALGPVFLGTSGLLTMDPFDQLWWCLAGWVLVRLIKREDPRLWLLFGLVAGVGLLTKVTMAYYGFALVLGLLLTPQRKFLYSRWLVLGGGIALLIFSPYLVWQVQHGFPTLEFWRYYASSKTYPVTPIEFFVQQVIIADPLALPLWLGGLYFLFFTSNGRPYRPFGWAYLILYVFFTIQKAKFYFLAPTYPLLFAAGACALQQYVQDRPRRRWLVPTAIRVLLVSGLVIIPYAVPVLPPEAFIRYNAFWGGIGDVKQERWAEGALPQNYADRYGWPEMVAQVARVYAGLPAADKAQACLLARNYGQAGAIDFYGPAYGLPPAISGHNSYYIWGPRDCNGQVIITVGFPTDDMAAQFRSVQEAGHTQCTYCMPFENNVPIAIARGLKVDIKTAWPLVKAFN